MEDVEQWSDQCFKGILQEYGASYCKEILQKAGHVKRENTIKVSLRISAYLKGLNLKGAVTDFVCDNHLRGPPPKKTEAALRIRVEKVATGGVWGVLNVHEDNSGRKKSPSFNKLLAWVPLNNDLLRTQKTLDNMVSLLQSSFNRIWRGQTGCRRRQRKPMRNLCLRCRLS